MSTKKPTETKSRPGPSENKAGGPTAAEQSVEATPVDTASGEQHWYARWLQEQQAAREKSAKQKAKD